MAEGKESSCRSLCHTGHVGSCLDCDTCDPPEENEGCVGRRGSVGDGVKCE